MKHKMLATAASLGLGIFLTPALQAQVRPMPPDPYDAQQAPAQTQASAPQPALPAANDYPAAEVQAVPGALARLAAARAEFNNAQSAIYRVIDQLKDDFEYSADLSAAMRNEKAAYERYVTARDGVLKQVASVDDYQTLKNLCNDLNDRLYSLKANPQANKAEIIATAHLKLAYATKMSDMESSALKSDSATQDARAKLIEASAKVSDLRAAFQRSVRHDQKYLVAQKELEDARVARVAAAALLDGALEARDLALEYAYYLHRSDPYTYRYTGNNYYGYPYDNYNAYGGGYGYGYAVNRTIIYNPNSRSFR